MKKQQRIITSNDLSLFHQFMESALKDEWTVVPGTIVAAISRASSSAGMMYDSKAFIAILEKDQTVAGVSKGVADVTF